MITIQSDNMNLTLGYSPIVMSMSLSYAYSLCVNEHGGTKAGGKSQIQEPSHI